MGRISFLMLGFLTLFMPPLTSAAQNSSCTLEANLYENRKPPAGGHAAEGKDTKAIDKEYMDFFRALAESSLSENKGSFDLCAELAKNDPIAARVVTFVRYLREGRRNSDEFISSFPTTEAQLTDFWSLDVIAMHSVGHGPASLPGIPLPDGIVDKLLSELFALVLQDNPAATKKYFFIFGNSNGEYSEFMSEQIKSLFEEHADLVLKEWSLMRPYRKRLVSISEDNSPEFSQKIAQTFQALCDKRNDPSCKEILKIFR